MCVRVCDVIHFNKWTLIMGVLMALVHYCGIGQPATISRITDDIVVDGLLDESCWRAIPPLPLSMFTPKHGGAMTEKTVIQIAYNDKYLFVGIRCYDSNPDGPQSSSMTRDGMSFTDDFCGILLDTFNDNENAVTFITTPSGIREDWAVYNDGEPVYESGATNPTWNTYWEVATTNTHEGWFGEMRIPFSSLRFNKTMDSVTMGLMAWRYIPRKNEVHSFPDLSPEWANAVLKPSLGEQVTFEGIEADNLVYVTPYLLGGVESNNKRIGDSASYLHSSRAQTELGLDIKYGLMSNVTLDVTLNTDFAQVEADDQLVNLTRFSLFFPEKRQFFQERASLFDVSLGGSNRLFHSRRIGLSENGPVRIYAGVRLVGRVGGWDFGILDMQTAANEDTPSENFAVLRGRKRILNQHSYLGALLTSRRGSNGRTNLVYGVDGLVRVIGDDYLKFNWAQSFDEGQVHPGYDNLSRNSFARINWTKRISTGVGYEFDLSRSGERFNPGIGFFPRNDYTRLGDRLFFGWLSSDSSPFYSHNVTLQTNAYLDNATRQLESIVIGPEWNINLKDGSAVRVSFKNITEKISIPFPLAKDISVPVGSYHFSDWELTLANSSGRRFHSSITLNGGTFYDGRKWSISTASIVSLSKHLEFSLNNQWNYIKFPSRHEQFQSYVGQLYSKVNFSTQTNLSTVVQYNSLSSQFNLNIRFRYNPQEGTDLFLVYNHAVNTERRNLVFARPLGQTILLKYSTTFLY